MLNVKVSENVYRDSLAMLALAFEAARLYVGDVPLASEEEAARGGAA